MEPTVKSYIDDRLCIHKMLTPQEYIVKKW